MRTLAPLVLACLASSCVVHVHVHEAPHETGAVSPEPRGPGHTSPSRASSVSGVVVDAAGNPIQARIAIVSAGGSTQSWTDEAGRFSLESHADSGLVAHANSEDGRVAVQSVPAGAQDVRLVLAPGGVVMVDYTGPAPVRCAIFHGDLRLEDFTVHPDRAVRVVVPTGSILVRLYDSRLVHVEQSFQVAAGETDHARLAIGI